MSTSNPLARLVGKPIRLCLAHRETVLSGRLLSAADEMLQLETEDGHQIIVNWLHVATLEGPEAAPPGDG
jgi:hypothetical protein